MPSVIVLTAILAALASTVSTQSVAPDSVPGPIKAQWCQQQQFACPLICSQVVKGGSTATESNTCDSDTLTFECVCSNGQSPNASEYSQTIPYFECTEAATQCVNSCAGSSSCQSACRDNHPCGAQNPKRVNLTTASSTSTATGTSNPSSEPSVASGLGGSPTTTTSPDGKKNAGSVTINLAQSYGLGALVAAMAAGFALLI